MANLTGLGIKRIRVRGLFGLYDYDIPSESESAQINKIMILYGQNGAGKTTLLNLIFHLLATAPREGHKTYIAKTKFNRLEIELTNGVLVWAKRKMGKFIGSFETGCEIKGEVKKAEWIMESDDLVGAFNSKEELKHAVFLEAVSSLNLQLYLISDNRRVQLDGEHPTFAKRRAYQNRGEGWHTSESREEDPEVILFRLLNQSIRKAEEWLRGQVIRGTSRGESEVNDIYAEIIKNLMTPTDSKAKKSYSKEDIIKRLNDIETRNNSYKKYGLTPKFNAGVLGNQVREASGSKLTNVKRILMPYLDSFEAKLNAMQEVQNRISSLVETINSFLVDKNLAFNIRRGFTIISKSKEMLKPEMLSSGERHLLLLFCNTITALGKRCIFIIDEPEISLNMVWQRSLVDSLLSCSKGSPIQYIFASHSMEIISQHLEKVVKLESK